MRQLLPAVPLSERDRVARFLEKQNFKPQALTVAVDPDLRFTLALGLHVRFFLGGFFLAFCLALHCLLLFSLTPLLSLPLVRRHQTTPL